MQAEILWNAYGLTCLPLLLSPLWCLGWLEAFPQISYTLRPVPWGLRSSRWLILERHKKESITQEDLTQNWASYLEQAFQFSIDPPTAWQLPTETQSDSKKTEAALGIQSRQFHWTNLTFDRKTATSDLVRENVKCKVKKLVRHNLRNCDFMGSDNVTQKVTIRLALCEVLLKLVVVRQEHLKKAGFLSPHLQDTYQQTSMKLQEITRYI